MTLYHTLAYYSAGSVGTFVWHQFIWNPPPFDDELDEILPNYRPWELKENPRDRVATDIARSIFWPVYFPKMIVGSFVTLEQFCNRMDEKIKNKFK